jgi:hypothetical protein
MIMSSNNAILIREDHDIYRMRYSIWDICVDTYPDQEGFLLKEGINDLREAIKFAQTQYSEYGIHFELLDE